MDLFWLLMMVLFSFVAGMFVGKVDGETRGHARGWREGHSVGFESASNKEWLRNKR